MKLTHNPSEAPTQNLGARLAIVAALAGIPACSASHQEAKTSSSSSDTLDRTEAALNEMRGGDETGYYTGRLDTRKTTKPYEDHPASVHTAK